MKFLNFNLHAMAAINRTIIMLSHNKIVAYKLHATDHSFALDFRQHFNDSCLPYIATNTVPIISSSPSHCLAYLFMFKYVTGPAK